jgi:hypothetical protein
MKGFSMGVTTVYIIAMTTSFSVDLLVDGHKYKPMTDPQNSDTTDRWEPQVEKALWIP